jgi:hypothetical protein
VRHFEYPSIYTRAERKENGQMIEVFFAWVGLKPEKRIRRTAEEKLRIVAATLVPGASIARMAREPGVEREPTVPVAL